MISVVVAIKDNIVEIIRKYMPRPKSRAARMTRRKAVMKSLDAAVELCSKNAAKAAETKGTIAYVASSVSKGLQAEPKAKKSEKTGDFAPYIRDKVFSRYKVLQKKTRRANYSIVNKMKQKDGMDVVKEAKLKMQRFYLMQNPTYFIG